MIELEKLLNGIQLDLNRDCTGKSTDVRGEDGRKGERRGQNRRNIFDDFQKREKKEKRKRKERKEREKRKRKEKEKRRNMLSGLSRTLSSISGLSSGRLFLRRSSGDGHSVDPILVSRDSKDNSIAILTLNRPDKLNSLTVEVGEFFESTIKSLRADASIRAVVITGSISSSSFPKEEVSDGQETHERKRKSLFRWRRPKVPE